MNASGISANGAAARRSSGLPLNYLLRYALAILSVGVALGTGLLLQQFHFHVPGVLLLFAVAISSWYGGRGPAVLAAVLAIISHDYYFLEPAHTLYINRSEIPYFIIFVAFTALLAWFGSVRRRIEAGLRTQADLLNLTHDTIFVMDMHGVIQYWNRGAEERYGWPAEEVVGKVVHDLVNTVFPSPLEEIKTELVQTGRWEGELVHTKKDGTQVVVASRWALQRRRDGAPVAILETNNDITERKRGEEALRRLNRELGAISDCNQTLLRATDEQSLLEEICRIVCEEAGYRMAFAAYAEHDEAKSVRPVAWTGTEEGYLATAGITWADTERGCGPTGMAIRSGKTCCIQDFATDPRVAPWHESALRRDFRSAIALPLKDEHANAFGSLTIFSAQPNAFTSQEIRLLEELAGDLAFGIVTLRSQAARKQAEGALRESETRFRALVDHAGDAFFVYDFEHGTIVDVNRQACEGLGYTREELIGKTPLAFHLDSQRPHMKSIAARAAGGEPVFDTHWHRRKDGSTFPVEVRTSLVSYGGRRFLLKVARDISDRMQAEEQRAKLRQLEADLAHINRVSMLGELAASVAHELKQPIAAAALDAATCVQWLRREPPNVHEAGEAAGRIIDDANRADEIIDRLRTLYTKSPPKRELVDVNDMIRQMVALLLGEASRHAVSIRPQLADGLPKIMADRVQLQQVLMNLMLNAIEAMHDTGGILTVTPQLGQDDQVEISISDTGVGLPAGKADQIFNAFFTTKAQGSGMGLSITRSIVESHGGRIWATSNDGRGVTFHFALPIAAAVDAEGVTAM